MRYLALGIVGGLFFSLAGPVAAPVAGYPPLQAATSSDASYNWAGYVAEGERYTAVSGSWIVPAVSSSDTLSADATWVGIGGAASEDLIQAGTQAVADSEGEVAYQAWLEVMPKASRPLPVAVSPGDRVSASLALQSPGVWRLIFSNETTGKKYSTLIAYESSLSSAEWIEEMPSTLRGGFLALDSFGTLRFTAASATVNGQTKNIDELEASPISMMTRRGEMLAIPSVVADDGSFAVARTEASAALTGRTTAPRVRPLLPWSGIPHAQRP